MQSVPVRSLRPDGPQTELATLRERLSLLLVHDFKNPLGIIKINLDLLKEDEHTLAPEQRDCLDDAVLATQRLLGMVLDLLDIGRAEENQLAPDLSPTAVDALVEETAAQFRGVASRRQITIRHAISDGTRALVDRKLFLRVLENITSNALRYTPDRGEVCVEVRSAGAQIEFVIENDGPSIPESQRAMLFEKYGQLSRGSHANRGLGLYFCRLVVEAHGGTIAATDRPGGGARFVICLPRCS